MLRRGRLAPARRISAVPGALLLVQLLTASAEAHVQVWPAESSAGSTQLYHLSVPCEKDVPTVRVEVQFPEGLTVLQVEPISGWSLSIGKDAAGHVSGAVWQGGAILPDQLQEFGVLAANPSGAAQLRWQAIQTYADGSEVQWNGPPSSQQPAAITRINDTRPDVALLLAGAALVVALGALVVALAGRIAPWRGRS